MKNLKVAKDKFYQAIQNLSKLKILVIGDIILDEYVSGEVHRISPEAPVPVIEVQNESVTLGGCGNVIKNLSKIGINTCLISRCGLDEKEKILISLLENEKIETSFLLKSTQIPTILKTRIIAKNQQLCRIDREKNIELSLKDEEILFEKFEKMLEKSHSVILSDYGKGLLSKNFIDRVIQKSLQRQISVFVDPQVQHFFDYKSVTTMTPNHLEIGSALGQKLDSDTSIEKSLKTVTQQLHLKFLVVTRGKYGMSLYLPKINEIFHIPTVAKEVFDVTGAGDTVISVLAAFLTAGLTELEAVLVANVAAGIVVNKFGSATVSCEEIEKELLEQNLLQ